MLVLAAVLLFTGCNSAPESGGYAVVIIAGRRANVTFPSKDALLRDSNLQTLVQKSVEYGKLENGQCYGEANLHFILCDGDPGKVDPIVPIQDGAGEPAKISTLLRKEDGNYTSIKRYFEHLTEWVADALTNESLRAEEPEADLINAIADAKDILNQPKYNNKQKFILLIDSGISTSGYLRMQDFSIQNITGNETPDVIVNRLAEDAMIDLSGIHVDFFGLGCADGLYQPKLNGETMKADLAAFWTAYVEDGCGGKVAVTPLRATSEIDGTPLNSGYPDVSVVPFVDTYTYTPDPSGKKPVKPNLTKLVFHEKTLTFIENQAIFANRDDAITQITNQAGYFQQIMDYDPEAVFYVVGSIARIGIDHTQENGTLSYDRAYEVAKIMVEEAGVPAEKIRLIKGGLTMLPWRNAVEYPGELEENKDEAAQDKNRVVAIVPSIFEDQMAILNGTAEGYTTDLLSIAKNYPG